MKSIRVKGMIFSSIILFMLAMTLFLGSYSVYQNSLKKVTSDDMLEIAKESAGLLNNFIDGYLAPLEELADNDKIKTMDWAVQYEVISKQINPNYENVAVVDCNGIAHYLDDTVIDLSDREYIQTALSGKRCLSEVIVSRKTGVNVIMAAVPIQVQEQVVGVLIARLDMTLLHQYIATKNYGINSEVYILSNQGSKIIVSYENMENEISNLFEQAAIDSDYKGISDFVSRNRNNTSGVGSYKRSGSTYYACFAAIGNTNWKIYIGKAKEEVLKEIRNVFLILALGTCIISSIIIWIVWLLIKDFTKPILQLEQLMEKGSKGDFDVHFIPKTEDEIAHLGMSFNHLMDKIKTLTYFDPVTSLLNRYVLKNDIISLIDSSAHKEFTLIMVQIDSIQTINEQFGYDISDSILKQAAARIVKVILKRGKVYRYRGDAFIISIQASMKEKEIYEITHNVLNSLLEPYTKLRKGIEVKFNLGCYTRTEKHHYENPLKAVAAAANYAKELGGNQIQKFNFNINKLIDERNNMLSDIYEAIEKEQFFLVYQPLFYLENGSIAKAEALIRWQHPQKGLIYPNTFIEIAETSEAIITIDFWVLEEVCKVLSNRKKAHKPLFPISVNITSKTFEREDFINRVEELFQTYEVDTYYLELEITERMVINKVEDSISKLESLRARGMKVSIDDFGIGYSSLSYIVRLPIDSVKIDRAFVEQLNSSKQAKAIISAIINLCKSLELLVVAEGIEKWEELEYLRQNHCDIGQGYYFSKPILLDEIENFLSIEE